MHLVRVLPGFLRGALTFASGGESIASGFPGFHRAVAKGSRSGKSLAGGRERVRAAAIEDEMVGVKCPGRIKCILPGRPPGSRNLPWDGCRIATKPANLQGSAGLRASGWDGGLAFARGADGGIVPGSGTSGTAESLSVGDWCVVGRPCGGNAPGGRPPRGVRSTRRRSVSGGGEALVRASPPWTAIRRRRSATRRAGAPGPARGHAAKPLFRAWCATGRVVTSLRGIRGERRHPIAATPAAHACVRCGTGSVSTWPARRKPGD